MKTKLIVHPFELDCDWVDRMSECGIDVLGIHPEGGGNAHESLVRALDIFETEEYRAAVDYALSKGMTVEYEMHAMSYLLPRELFSEHPEWFRMTESGERTPRRNFCVSNPDALDYVAERAAALVKQLYRSAPNYYIWLDDVKGAFCSCPRCRELSPSDQNLTVMNAILRRLKKDDPAAALAYLAYYECITPPALVKPYDGIFLEYAPFERDITKSAQLVPDSDRENLQRLFDFFGIKTAWLLEYWYDNSWYDRRGTELKIDSAMIADDISYYKSLGFENISSFACLLGRKYTEKHGEPDLSAISKA